MENDQNCRQSKLFYKSPSPHRARTAMSWQRLQLGRYIRAITSHNNHLYHLHNMYSFISPICRFCNKDNEEFYHLAYLWPALWHERQQINALEKDHYDWTMEQIVEFTLIPRIDQAFVKPLYWVEDERELLEVPDQDSQPPSPSSTTSTSSSSSDEESVMAASSLASSLTSDND